ncbi:MAG: hypothetical protein H6744_07425 [Deltaproteobacteria bacterium]|nr:hypothetical protein [Candidatus Latescibacterota bacterium]MCB9728972.1 hypothetical protein [Deltaproteobacteria bacterium]MCB9786510.1 hypothetical protein [Deltaproteobacteria bacterium]
MSLKLAAAMALLTLILPSARAASADDAEPVGELRVSLNSEYCKVKLDGEDWSAVEFENGGKTLIVLNLDLGHDSTEVTLEPAAANLEPVTFTITPKDFKRIRRGRIYYMVATHKVTFPTRKAAPAPAPAPEKPAEPEKPAPERGGDEL